MKKTALFIFLIIVFAIQLSNAEKPEFIEPYKVSPAQVNKLKIPPNFLLADTCSVRHDVGDTGEIFGYGNWVTGVEWYHVYLDPCRSCDAAYPYTITEVHFYLLYKAATVDTFTAEIASVNYSDPGCTQVGQTISITSAFEVTVSDSGLWDIVIELDSPIVVNEPFFAGVYLHDVATVEAGPDLITDKVDDLEFCVSYNWWDVDTGMVDLATRGFLGRTIMFAGGFPGGGNCDYEPPPMIKFVIQQPLGAIFGPMTFWAQELSGSNIIENVSFQYSLAGQNDFIEIDSDFDGYTPLRDGVNDNGNGDGFSVVWDPSLLTSTLYDFRAVATDTLKRVSIDSITNVFLFPTIPTPNITSPLNGFDFCENIELLMNNSPENMDLVEIYLQPTEVNYSVGLDTLDQSQFGGESGVFYNAPIAAALAIQMWADRGFTDMMKINDVQVTLDELVEHLAGRFLTRLNSGTYDEDMFMGMINYFASIGIAHPKVNYARNPNYFEIRNELENNQKAVMIGLGGEPGIWFALDGFTGWIDNQGSYTISVSDPISGSIVDLPIRVSFGISEVLHNGIWQKIDRMFTIDSDNWAVTRNLLGSDEDGSIGWAFNWTPIDLVEGTPYFFTAKGIKGNNSEYSSVLLKYECFETFQPGDYDDDGIANINDFIMLQAYIVSHDVPPIGGAFRADANGDDNINIADLIYYVNFLFGHVSDPVY